MFNRAILLYGTTLTKIPSIAMKHQALLLNNFLQLQPTACSYSSTSNVSKAANQAATETSRKESNVTREELYKFMNEYEIKETSTPVRREFMADKPLKSKDLEAIDIHVYHRKPGKEEREIRHDFSVPRHFLLTICTDPSKSFYSLSPYFFRVHLWLYGLLHRQIPPLVCRRFLPQTLRPPCHSAGDCCRCPGHGRRNVLPSSLPPQNDKRLWVDREVIARSWEWANAPYDLDAGHPTDALGKNFGDHSPGDLLECLRVFLYYFSENCSPNGKCKSTAPLSSYDNAHE